MDATIDGGGHLDDAALVQMLDGGLAAERAAVDEHLGRCTACAARLAEAQRGDAMLSALLAGDGSAPTAAERARARLAIERAAPRARHTRTAWRRPAAVAATLLVVVAGAAAAKPVRAWLLARLTPHDGAAPSVATTSPATTPAAAAPARTTVRFAVDGETFAIDVAAPQRVGEIEIARGQGAPSAVAVVGGATETVVVLPGGVRLLNDSASTASYRVESGAGVRRVVISVGGGPARTIEVTGGARRRVPLQPGAAPR